MFVAEQLGRFEHEVLGLSNEEIARWMAYFNVKAEYEKKELDKAKRKSARRPRRF